MYRVQYAIHKLHRLFIGEFARQLQRLIDGHRRGRASTLDFIDRQTQNIAVHGGHALHAPVLGVPGDLLVHFSHMLYRAAHQVGDKRIAQGLLLGEQRIVIGVDDLVDRLAPGVPQE